MEIGGSSELVSDISPQNRSVMRTYDEGLSAQMKHLKGCHKSSNI